MIDTEIAIAQIGTNGQLYISDFNTPIPFRQIRGGGQSNPGGICAYKGMALIGIFGNTNNIHDVLGNGIYSIGRVNKNAPIVLNLEYQLTCDEIYSVVTVGSDILLTYRLNGAYGVKRVDPGTYATAVYQSLDLIAPIKNTSIGRVMEVVNVDIQCEKLLPGCAIEVWYKIDKNTSEGAQNDGWIQSNMQGGDVQLATHNAQNAVFLAGEKGRVAEVMVKLIPSGNRSPEINEVNVYASL